MIWKDREIDVSQPAPDQILAAILLQHALEIAEEFRHAIAPEILGAPLRRRLLLLVIEPARDRMVRVVDLDDEIGDGELELMRPKPSRLVARRQIQARAEIEQDIRGLRDDELAGFEERRRKRRPRAALVVDDFHHRRHAGFAFAARDIDIVGAGFFQRQPDELAASLDRSASNKARSACAWLRVIPKSLKPDPPMAIRHREKAKPRSGRATGSRSR